MPMGWVSSWVGYCLAQSSVSAPCSVPAFLVDRINFGLKVLCVSWCPYNATGFLPGFRRWPLQVPYPQCCESQLRSPPLILQLLPSPRSLSLSGDVPASSPPLVADFHSFSWPSGHPSCASPNQILNPHSPPMSLPMPSPT